MHRFKDKMGVILNLSEIVVVNTATWYDKESLLYKIHVEYFTKAYPAQLMDIMLSYEKKEDRNEHEQVIFDFYK